MENYFEKELYINPSLADAEGLLNRYETFNIFMDVADDHAGKMGVAWRHISPRNLFWLTVKTKIVFEDRPKLGDTVTLATWSRNRRNSGATGATRCGRATKSWSAARPNGRC